MPGCLCLGTVQGKRPATPVASTSGGYISESEQEHQARCDSLSRHQIVVGSLQTFAGGSHSDPGKNSDFHGCQPVGWGAHLSSPGPLVSQRDSPDYQLPGVVGHSICSAGVCLSQQGGECTHLHRQHEGLCICESTGGGGAHQDTLPSQGSPKALSLGRKKHHLHKGRTCGQGSKM